MVIISALKFTIVDSPTVHDTITDAYFLFLGIVTGLSQLGIKCIQNNFRFLNYHWGKFLLSTFLASMAFSSGHGEKSI